MGVGIILRHARPFKGPSPHLCVSKMAACSRPTSIHPTLRVSFAVLKARSVWIIAAHMHVTIIMPSMPRHAAPLGVTEVRPRLGGSLLWLSSFTSGQSREARYLTTIHTEKATSSVGQLRRLVQR